jgi:hypothetical protein
VSQEFFGVFWGAKKGRTPKKLSNALNAALNASLSANTVQMIIIEPRGLCIIKESRQFPGAFRHV